MDIKENDTPRERMNKRGEKPVLCMQREEGMAVFRYLVAVSKAPPMTYSIYAEYEDGTTHTIGEIPHFSEDRDMAESFCGMLERWGVTPLSLEAIYEDIYTP